MAVEPGKELLWKYVFGQCDPAEIAFVESWIKSNPENQKELDRIRLYQSMNESNNGSGLENAQQSENNLEEKPYRGYFYAILLMILVFILLYIFSRLRK